MAADDASPFVLSFRTLPPGRHGELLPAAFVSPWSPDGRPLDEGDAVKHAEGVAERRQRVGELAALTVARAHGDRINGHEVMDALTAAYAATGALAAVVDQIAGRLSGQGRMTVADHQALMAAIREFVEADGLLEEEFANKVGVQMLASIKTWHGRI